MANANPSVADPGSDRELTLTRVIRAPARILFDAHRRPEFLRRWFGPASCPLASVELDFRVGGRYRFVMKGPGGPAFGGEYLAIVEDRRIAYTSTLEEPGAETMVVTVTLDEDDGVTTLTHHTRFASARMRSEHFGRGYEVNLGSTLDVLAALAAAAS